MKLITKTNTSLSLKWELSSTYRGPDPKYTLRWKILNEEEFSTIEIEETSKEAEFTINSLKPFSSYEIQIRANNNAGSGRWSATLEESTLTGSKNYK